MADQLTIAIALTQRRILGPMILDRATCDWVIDEDRDTAICRTHGEVVDGVDSEHFPDGRRYEGPSRRGNV